MVLYTPAAALSVTPPQDLTYPLIGLLRMSNALISPLLLLLLWSCTPIQQDLVTSTAQPTSVVDPVPGPVGTSKLDTALAYSNAIGDYIAAMTKRDGSFPGTLYINKHVDFPAIKLPALIAGSAIRVVDPSEAEAVKGAEDFACLNIFGWFTDSTAEFQMVRFSQGFSHRVDGRDDCHLHYSIGAGQQMLALDSLRF